MSMLLNAMSPQAERYNELLKGLPITLPWQHEDSYSGLHLYVIRLQLDKISKTHLDVFNGMREAGILVNLHYVDSTLL